MALTDSELGQAVAAAQSSVSAAATVVTAVSWTPPVGALRAGSLIRLVARGAADSTTTGTAFNWGLTAGGVSLASVVVTLSTNTTRNWKITAEITVRAGLVLVGGLELLAASQATNANTVSVAHQPSTSVGYSTPVALALTFNLGTATASAAIRCEQAYIELVKL